MPIDVLYYLGKGSKWSNNEIRYSLRSLERFGRNVGRVFIVGVKPDFLNETVGFLPYPDEATAFINSKRKITAGVRLLDGLTQDVIVMMDDVFLSDPIDFEQFKNYHRGDHLPKDEKKNNWWRTITASGKLLRGLGFSDLNYEEHGPFKINRKKWLELSEIWDLTEEMKIGLAWRSIYGNFHKIAGEALADCKIRGRFIQERGSVGIEETIQGRPFFSIDDEAPASGFADWITRKFPSKSKWEL